MEKKLLVIYYSQTGQLLDIVKSVTKPMSETNQVKLYFVIFSPKENFDLVILAYQPWYLSPSIPFHAFFQKEETKRLLAGKPVITIIGCRNMWTMAQENVKAYIKNACGQLVGNIVLRDKAPNLLSVVSI